ncbi:sigma-54 interaction domain-containing protein [Desmospora profundinema]|uniref:PAS domain S-box-containing protein n=1 Tax=Desmospora profundinema TaxID=1571184 RepID=A0ABU1IKI2_9BACL|nr:sigma 54-interacting transcriptional regulator [Desmospora profundinema]MDR6224913.1 PAS domain S-box-containing protein [Desmospora profundinema]
MQHHLPCIEEMIQSDFTLIHRQDDRDWNPNRRNHEMIFMKDGDRLFYIDPRWAPLDKDVPFASIPWMECASVRADQPMKEVVALLQTFNFLLVTHESGKEIGYLSCADVLGRQFESYQYLHAYFESVIQTMDASVSLIDENKRVMVWTQGAENIFSVEKEEIIGKPITNFFDIDKLEIIKTLDTGKSLYKHQHQPRSDMVVLIHTNPIILDDRIIGAVAAETDITSQVRLNHELFKTTSKVHRLEREVAKLKPSSDPFHMIKGNSSAMKKTKEMIRKIGSTNATVLVLGESGVGKELFAKAIHDIREASDAPFIPINCGAIPPSLFESELFGYEKGAFSGADHKGKKGKIELARGGTLFLDEIGEMPFEMQVKLLRVLQEKKYFAVGGTKQVDADFRVIAATNRDLKSLVDEGKFREDLFYRLNVVTLHIPPLRERREDIIELTHYFLYEFSVRYNRPIHGISQDVMQHLLQYDWPGNIRELRNGIERLVVFATDGNIKREDLPFTQSPNKSEDFSYLSTDHASTLREELERHEKRVILESLKRVNGNKQACAKKLGISRATLYNRMNKLGIQTT